MFATGILCLSLLFAQLIPSKSAAANPVDTNIYESAFSNTDISLSGVMTAKSLYFQLEDYWNVSGVEINLDYQASPLTLEERSSVTLAINGTRFHSFRPVANEFEKQRLTVPVPLDLLTEGGNVLTVEGYIQTTIADKACLPGELRDNWLQLFKTSGAVIHYKNEALDGSISGFHKFFTGRDTVTDEANAIVVPSQSQPAELEAAVYALSGFAKANPVKEKAIPILTADSSSLSGKKAVVTIAMYDQLSAEIKSQLGSQDLTNAALIQVIASDKQSNLVITSKNEEMLAKAGRLMANQELVRQISGNMKVVDASTNVDTPQFSLSRNVTLTESGDSLKGWGHQERSYFISLPANRSIADASKISLDFRYAQNLDFDRSMVTILINDKPIGSKKLTPELANGDSLTLTIPKNLEISGNFTVTAAFDLELVNLGCELPPEEMPWAFITKDSIMQLNTKDRTELLFNDYPSPFLRDGSFNQVAVVLPKERDRYTYLTVSNLFNLLGQYAEGNTGNIRFYGDDASEAELKDRNIIAIGTYENNPLIREHNEQLFFQYDPSSGGFISNEKMSIDADYGKRLGTLQLLHSPYQAGHGFMAVTAAGSEYYYLASKLLSSDSMKWRVYGDGVATDKDDKVHAFRFKKQAAEQDTSLMQEVMARGDVLQFMAIGLSILVLVLASLFLLLRKYRKKRRESDET